MVDQVVQTSCVPGENYWTLIIDLAWISISPSETLNKKVLSECLGVRKSCPYSGWNEPGRGAGSIQSVFTASTWTGCSSRSVSQGYYVVGASQPSESYRTNVNPTATTLSLLLRNLVSYESDWCMYSHRGMTQELRNRSSLLHVPYL